jgi:hypothetical protein
MRTNCVRVRVRVCGENTTQHAFMERGERKEKSEHTDLFDLVLRVAREAEPNLHHPPSSPQDNQECCKRMWECGRGGNPGELDDRQGHQDRTDDQTCRHCVRTRQRHDT